MRQKFPYRYRVLALLFFLAFICQLDRIAFSIVGIRIKTDFHLNNEQFGWVMSAFALAYMLFEIPSGVLGDRIGQRSLFIRIVLWWSLFTVLTGITTGLLSLIAIRFLFGAGEAGAYPNITAAVSRWIPANETARSYSWIIMGNSAGKFMAPFIVVPIAVALGWRAPFFVLFIIGLLWAIICFYLFRNNPAEMKNIPAGEVAYIETNRRVKNHQQDFSWKLASKNKNFWALPLMYFGGMFGFNFFIFWLPLYLQEGLHFLKTK